jgi:hypothetical protein
MTDPCLGTDCGRDGLDEQEGVRTCEAEPDPKLALGCVWSTARSPTFLTAFLSSSPISRTASPNSPTARRSAALSGSLDPLAGAHDAWLDRLWIWPGRGSWSECVPFHYLAVIRRAPTNSLASRSLLHTFVQPLKSFPRPTQHRPLLSEQPGRHLAHDPQLVGLSRDPVEVDENNRDELKIEATNDLLWDREVQPRRNECAPALHLGPAMMLHITIFGDMCHRHCSGRGTAWRGDRLRSH